MSEIQTPVRQQTKPAIRLQERDLEIIKAIYDHRFLDDRQIAALFGNRGADKDGNEYDGTIAIRKRLKALTDLGYLIRPEEQITSLNKQERQGAVFVYGVGNKGASLVYPERLASQRRPDLTHKNRNIGFIHLNHTLLINDVYVALNAALRSQENKLPKLIAWEREAKKSKFITRIPPAKQGEGWSKETVYPDAFFTLQTNARPEPWHFFLEADRSTHAPTKIERRAAAYVQWRESGESRESKWGAKSFRVVFVVNNRRRIDSLRRATSNRVRGGQGSRMFVFTSMEDFDFTDPAKSILRPIFYTNEVTGRDKNGEPVFSNEPETLCDGLDEAYFKSKETYGA